MQKLKINLSELKVDSFQTGLTKSERGTIKANKDAETTVPVPSNDPEHYVSCLNTCYTCHQSCYPTCEQTLCHQHTCQDSCDYPCYPK